MQRIAVPMIGGMVSSTLLTLIVIPAIYALIKGYGFPRDKEGGSMIDQSGVDSTSQRSLQQVGE